MPPKTFKRGDRVTVHDWSYMQSYPDGKDSGYASEPWKTHGEDTTFMVIEDNCLQTSRGGGVVLDLIIEHIIHGERTHKCFRTSSRLVNKAELPMRECVEVVVAKAKKEKDTTSMYLLLG